MKKDSKILPLFATGPTELRAAVPTNVSSELQAHAVPREVGAEERGGLGAAADTLPQTLLL